MTTDEFVQARHREAGELKRPRELIVACTAMRSNVNLSGIARAAGCWGIRRLILCGNAKINNKIARDSTGFLQVEVRRTLRPVIARLQKDGYAAIGLEQTSGSQSIFSFRFPRKMVLVVGNERLGIEPELLEMLDGVVEIPVYGLPHAHNVTSATAMTLYEYCRQYPEG